MNRITAEFEAVCLDSNNEVISVPFELQTEWREVDNGFDYEYFGITGYHKQKDVELRETPLNECIISTHTNFELEIINKWIEDNEYIIEKKLLKKINNYVK